MKSVRKRLTYANVMSSIAVFLVLGGATAVAATTLGKNTVGSKQLKNNAVTSAKIKNGAVTGAKLKLSSIGKVPSASSADTANTANSAKTANTADSANTANNANNANNANTVAGSTIRKFFYGVAANAAPQQLLSLDGLTLTASCASGTPALVATTSAPGLIRSGGTVLGPTLLEAKPYYHENDTFETSDTFNLLQEVTDSSQGTFTYARPDGTVVTGTIESEEGGFSSFTNCVISGSAIG
jgi:hypothetical protein